MSFPGVLLTLWGGFVSPHRHTRNRIFFWKSADNRKFSTIESCASQDMIFRLFLILGTPQKGMSMYSFALQGGK